MTVVCLSFAPLDGHPEVERLRALEPRVEVVVAPYAEEEARRSSRQHLAWEELRASAPSLTAGQREAFRRAEVLLAFDVPVDLADHAPKLRWVHLIGAGVEHLRGAGLGRRRDVVVTNSSGLAAPSIAEFVIGRLLMIWKRFPEQLEHQRERRWVPTFGRMLAGSVLGVIGMGAIGTAVGERARALGMKVLGVRRSARPGLSSPAADELFGPDRLHEVLARSDAVVVAAPASAETFHLIDRAAFAAMQPGTVLVNVARGSLVDEEALVEAVDDGRIGAAALDVFEKEPLPAESPLWGLPNVYISAHSSVSVGRYIEQLVDLFAANLGRYLAGEPLRNVVDVSFDR